MTSYKISERDKAAQIINFLIYMQNSFCTCVLILYFLIDYALYVFQERV